jgi:hypothetical protein
VTTYFGFPIYFYTNLLVGPHQLVLSLLTGSKLVSETQQSAQTPVIYSLHILQINSMLMRAAQFQTQARGEGGPVVSAGGHSV